jgi:hypothetical protein
MFPRTVAGEHPSAHQALSQSIQPRSTDLPRYLSVELSSKHTSQQRTAQSSVPKFDWHNIWPFNHLQVVKTTMASVYFVIGGSKC